MVTVAEAASALGIDARTVREKLSTEEWKGEKRMIGLKEKWFMYRGELDRQLERLRIARPQERISTQGLERVFESEEATDTETVDAQAVEVRSDKQPIDRVSVAIDEVLTKLTEQFSKQLQAEKEIIFLLKRELDDKDRQLRLLPDLQKVAEQERQAAQLKELEAEALRKQIAAIEEEKSCTEQQLRDEAEQIRTEKEIEIATVKSELEKLAAQVENLRKPWWKRVFSAPENST